MKSTSRTLSFFILLAACTVGPAWADVPEALLQAIDARSAEDRARDGARHPGETLDFFKLEPGMTVVEALPGGGWYSKILLNALGPDGQLVGVNYDQALWPNFSFATEEFIANMANWTTTWPNTAQEWRSEQSATVSAFEFGSLDEANHGSADMVLLIRALHNMARFDQAFLDQAIADSYNILKPGGVVGVVQHEARESTSDEWASGANGYLKKSRVIAAFEAQGFEFVAETPVNQNALDIPGESDFVWRLPPSFQTSRDNESLQAEMRAIGESHRMTLKFVKPTSS